VGTAEALLELLSVRVLATVGRGRTLPEGGAVPLGAPLGVGGAGKREGSGEALPALLRVATALAVPAPSPAPSALAVATPDAVGAAAVAVAAAMLSEGAGVRVREGAAEGTGAFVALRAALPLPLASALAEGEAPMEGVRDGGGEGVALKDAAFEGDALGERVADTAAVPVPAAAAAAEAEARSLREGRPVRVCVGERVAAAAVAVSTADGVPSTGFAVGKGAQEAPAARLAGVAVRAGVREAGSVADAEGH
jgi:hypothetical protein